MENRVWDRICGQLKGVLPGPVFHSFVEGADCEHQDEESLRLSFHDRFSKENFEQKCLPALREVMRGLQLDNLNVVLSVTQVQHPEIHEGAAFHPHLPP